MTHGCLEIYSKEIPFRKIILHTYHDGMDIPEVVELALNKFIETKYWYISLSKRDQVISKDRIEKDIKQLCLDDGIDYPPTVTSYIIAARPGFLEPINNEFTEDLPTWSGLDHPYELQISNKEWSLLDEEDNLILSFNPCERFLTRLEDLIIK